MEAKINDHTIHHIDAIPQKPGEHMDRLLAIISKSKCHALNANERRIEYLFTSTGLTLAIWAVITSAAVSLFNPDVPLPGDDLAIETFSRTWSQIL